MISAADPIAARVGIDVLESGGNAVDAAIAVASVENVTLPAMCGLGGDVFAIVYEASTGRCTAINGSGVCAYKATPEYFLERGLRKMPISGLYSVAVPGAVHAYETIANLFATRPLGDLLQPAIEIAGQGFILPETTAGVIAGTAHVLGQFPTSALIFMPGGRSLQAGDRLRNPDLAKSCASLRLVALRHSMKAISRDESPTSTVQMVTRIVDSQKLNSRIRRPKSTLQFRPTIVVTRFTRPDQYRKV